jgi:3D (Asp-Asp-Asp) domain-containing protein
MSSIIQFDFRNGIWLNSLKLARNTVVLAVFILVAHYLFFAATVFASGFDKTIETIQIEQKAEEYSEIFNNTLPYNKEKEMEVAWSGFYTITAYSSDPGQCDNTPCITANGYDVCSHGIEDTIAANFLKFGTKVRIPELFGDRIFVVRDRMNARHDNRVDIWMIEKASAKKFGIKAAKIEVLEH